MKNKHCHYSSASFLGDSGVDQLIEIIKILGFDKIVVE